VPVKHLIDGLLGSRRGETRLDHPGVILEHSSPFWRGHHHAAIVGTTAAGVNVLGSPRFRNNDLWGHQTVRFRTPLRNPNLNLRSRTHLSTFAVAERLDIALSSVLRVE
jgi:hypothetical protein